MSTNSTLSWSIDIEDPWTITSFLLLGMLLITTSLRVYLMCSRKRPLVGTSSTESTNNTTTKNKAIHKTRSEMRS